MSRSALVTVRARDVLGQWEVRQGEALLLVAALGAEPETLEELAIAGQRYLPGLSLAEDCRRVESLDRAICNEQPWCLIDLLGRTLVTSSDFELPELPGFYGILLDDADQDEAADSIDVWLQLPGDWQVLASESDWRHQVDARLAAALGQPRRDVRLTLYGQPLLEHLVEGLLQHQHCPPKSEDEQLRKTQQIHAEWLMTPREDLGGKTPRELLLADRERINRDLERRANEWTIYGQPVPGLPPDSAAYRFGGFGTTEVVLYFELVRAVLARGWKFLRRRRRVNRQTLYEQLREARDRWFDAPLDDNFTEHTPRELIDLERQRIPIRASAHPIDHDCPICQAEAEGLFGPSFYWFDGHQLELEDEFAFSMLPTREEWECQQETFREIERRADQELNKIPDPAGRELSGKNDPLGEPTWRSSHVDWDEALDPGAPQAMATLAVAFRLAEIVCELKLLPGGRPYLEALNASYARLRRAVSEFDFRIAVTELCEQLEVAAQTYPQLVSRSADLQSNLHEMLRSRAG